MKTNQRITFVLPLAGERDISAACYNMLPSLDKFFPAEEIEEILIVATDKEYRTFNPAVVVSPQFADRIRVLPESKVISNDSSFRRARGWHKQQILKLEISRHINTQLYCTLDSDVLLLRPCRLEDWCIDGRCIYDPAPTTIHRKWWRRSARQLGYRINLDLQPGFGVTPALLYTDIARQLVQYLNEQRAGLTRAIRKGATEYTLYWLYLTQHDDFRQYYRDDRGSMFGGCIWKRKDIRRADLFRYVDHLLADHESFYFTVLQSTTGHIDEEMIAYIYETIRGSETTNLCPASHFERRAQLPVTS